MTLTGLTYEERLHAALSRRGYQRIVQFISNALYEGCLRTEEGEPVCCTRSDDEIVAACERYADKLAGRP